MDIEDLSKTQLLLLTILVNFVVAIATGVMTVSLLDQAPTTVTQTVNRIVDHTIETVTTQVPSLGGTPQTPSTEDLLTATISSNVSRTVTLKGSADGEVLGRGFYIFTARAVVVTQTLALPKKLTVVFADGSTMPAEVTREDTKLRIYTFTTDAALPTVVSADFAPSSTLKQGQSVISLGADGSATTGIITKISEEGVQTNLPALPASSVAMTLGGNIAGITGGGALFIPAEVMSASLTPGQP